MNALKIYLRFCRSFQNLNIPKLKFKTLDHRSQLLYINYFKIREEDLNKASFAMFSILIIFCTIVYLIFFNIIILGFTIIISLSCTYEFNTLLLKLLKKKEDQINSIINILKIDFALVQKTLNKASDRCINFISFIINYNTPLSGLYNELLRKIHEGYVPEDLLGTTTTFSRDFDEYVQALMVNNFQYDEKLYQIDDTSLEEDFKVYLKQLQNKIAIIFFIGLFFPIGFCFLVLFQIISPIFMILCVPVFLFFLYGLFKKYVKIDYLLIGLFSEHSRLELKKFQEFIYFIKNYATTLQHNISPEKAFIDVYNSRKSDLKFFKIPLEHSITKLITDSFSLNEVMEGLKNELKSVRYSIIIDSIKRMINENAQYSSKKILETLQIIQKHQKLEKELRLIIRSEKFKVFVFLILLPAIVGSIGGMIPFFSILNNQHEILTKIDQYGAIQGADLAKMSLIFLLLICCVIITSYFFLKIVQIEKKIFFILLSTIIFIIIYFLSMSTILSITI